MGILVSRLSSYQDVLMMKTDSHLHFKDTLQRQWTTAQAAGRMETLQSQMAAGTGAAAGTAQGWGMGFYGISTHIYKLSMFGVPLGLIMIAVVYFMKASEAAMAAAVFLTVFCFLFYLMFHAPLTRAGIQSGANIATSFIVAGVAAAIVGFFIYDKKEEEKEPSQDPILVAYTDESGQRKNTAVTPSNGNDLPAFSW